jgi:hypothetical protein
MQHWEFLQLVVSMASIGFFEKEGGQAYVELLVQQCATSDAGEKQVQVEQATSEKAVCTESAVITKNKVCLKHEIW